MAKRYYNLEKETKDYLKACGAKNIVNQTNITTLNDYIITRKNLNLDCNFLADNPIVIDDSLVLWLDSGVSSSYPAGGNIWKDLVQQTPASLLGKVGFTSLNKGNIIFDGTTTYASIPNSPSLNFGTSPFTISFFTFTTSTVFQGGSHINKGPVTSTGWGNRDFAFLVYSTLGEIARIGFNPTSNTWQHHTIVVKQYQSPYITYYRNGVQFATSTNDNPARLGSVDNSSNIFLSHGYGGANRYAGGYLPCVHLYNRELTQAEILQNFNALKGRFGL